MSSQYFFSVDWGTSSLRLRLVDLLTQTVIGEHLSDHGIAAVHAAWLQSGLSGDERFGYYLQHITAPAEQLLLKVGIQLPHLRIVISGMASANIGMMEIPYGAVPFHTNAAGLRIEKISMSHVEIQLISGAASRADVMRGEETQLIGAMAMTNANGLYIFPGTHSKHVTVVDGMVTTLRTFMTGEMFQLMTNYSLLKSSVENSNDNKNGNIEAFCNGVRCGAKKPLLHALFTVRTRHLLDRIGSNENYHYLSGILIGSELASIREENPLPITLCGENLLMEKYRIALTTLGIASPIQLVDAGLATITGHLCVYRHVYGAYP